MSIWARQKAIDRLADRLAVTEDLCAGLDRANKKLDLEFTELYDKVRHQMSRMAKRDALSQKKNGEDTFVPEPDLPFPDADPISRSIMMRRAGQGIKK